MTKEQRFIDRLRKNVKQGAGDGGDRDDQHGRPRGRSRTVLTILEFETPGAMAVVLGDAIGDSMILQSKTVAQTKTLIEDVFRRRLLAYAQFWQRLSDMGMTLVIFATLCLLSLLPILQVQTSILFNRAFATILERKIHKQELLDDLYTPALFVRTEADPEPEGEPGKKVARAVTRLRRGSIQAVNALGAAARRGAKGDGTGRGAVPSGHASRRQEKGGMPNGGDASGSTADQLTA